MILTKIIPINFGPFSDKQTIEIEKDVTVLTGSNDTGKSSILNLIKKSFIDLDKNNIVDFDVNIDYLSNTASGQPWTNDSEIGCLLYFEKNDLTQGYTSIVLPNESTGLIIKCSIAPGVKKKVITHVLHGSRENRVQNQVPNKFPKPIFIQFDNQIRDTIPLTSPTEDERKLLSFAFGDNFNYNQIKDLTPILFSNIISKANDKLNNKLKSLFPSSIGIEFNVSTMQDNKSMLNLFLKDPHYGNTPLGMRGTGVRKFLTFLCNILGAKFDDDHYIILLDEPENSLHSDAQHFLRKLLEELAQKPTVQVIYSTHSPSMINLMKPQSLRLLKRAVKNDKATTIVDNHPFKDNYFKIRSSLGISPADSLLYAPVTVIIEGDTEAVCLPSILEKLANSGKDEFKELETALTNIHILNGSGDSLEYFCQIVKSQNAKPIIFVDGDKIKKLSSPRFKEKHPDVPVIHLDPGKEFEQIIPEIDYFKALSSATGKPLASNDYDNWLATAGLHPQMMFSKKLDRWLETVEPNFRYNKPEVMRLAINEVDIDKIELRPFIELTEKICSLMSRST